MLARSVLVIFRCLPLAWAMKLGVVAGRFWFAVDTRHRKVALNNLAAVFPDKPQFEINRIARQCFEEQGRSLMVSCRLLGLADKSRLADLVSGDLTPLKRAYKKNRGLLMVTAHFGAWELLPLYYSIFGTARLNIIVRPLDNKFINKLLEKYRTSNGRIGVISKKKAARAVMAKLKNKESVGIMVDQNVSADKGVFVDFLGIPACTTTAPAIFAIRTGVPVVPIFIYRDGPTHYRVSCGEEIVMQKSDNLNNDVRLNTQRITDALTEMVYRYPQQWFWVHRRWKTRPSEENGDHGGEL